MTLDRLRGIIYVACSCARRSRPAPDAYIFGVEKPPVWLMHGVEDPDGGGVAQLVRAAES